MDLASFAIQLLNALQYGLLLFLVASGLTLIFGIMGIINLAHGSFYMIGAYMAFTLSSLTGSLTMDCRIPRTTAWFLLESPGFAVRHGSRDSDGRDLAETPFCCRTEFAFGNGTPPDAHEKVTTDAASGAWKRGGNPATGCTVYNQRKRILIFEELRSILVGNDVHGVAVPAVLASSIPLGPTLTYPAYRLFMSAVCLVIAGGMYFLIQRTRLGMMIRAGASNREMVQTLGLNIGLVYRLVFALGVALAAFAGMIAAPVSSVYPGMGTQVLIICFVVVVIGGIGSVWGALAAALLIGLVDTFGKVFVPDYAGVAIYVLMAAILLWRPEGLFRRT